MSETQTPSNEDFMRRFIALERKVADISNSSVGGSFVTGDLIGNPGATRAGCLLCDGSTIADADYPALAALIRASYPAAYVVDGGHVKLPDYRGATMAGADGATFVLGVETGVEAVTLTSTQSGQPGIAAGVSGSTTPGSVTSGAGSPHAHASTTGQFITTSGGGTPAAGTNAVTTSANTATEASHTHSVAGSAHTHTTPAVAAANAAASHTNVQPTLPTNVFIKT